MTIKKRIVGVIGLGHVGAHVAFCLGMMGIADEVLLCDVKQDKLVSECNDLMDTVKFMPHQVNYKIAAYEELASCDVIVNAAGDIKLCATGSRDDEMNFTVVQIAGYIEKVMAGGFDGIFVNITNPCDVITDLIAKKSGLPKNRVLGTGTGLDTARLIHALSEQTGLASSSITAYMFGEHGNAQMTPWSAVNFAGQPLANLAADPKFNFDHQEMTKRAIGGGWVTYSGKGCTEYGIAATAATIVQAILHDEKKIMPVSAWLGGAYGEDDIYCGCPAIIGAGGMEKVVEFPLTAGEKDEFKECCAKIRGNIAKAAKLL